MQAEVNDIQLVRINAPEIYQDPEFKRWFIERPDVEYEDGKGHPAAPIATWHGDAEEPHEYSDFFTTMEILGEDDDGKVCAEGSDSNMPEHIWHRLTKAAWEALNKPKWNVKALIWVSNLDGIFDA